ncbi:MAG: type I 3-dehydroquinate dehydratase [Promethearchaeota archaeon]
MKKLPIAVAVQVTEHKLKDGTIFTEIENTGKTNASYIELRIDYCRKPASIDINPMIKHANNCGLGTIVTCRHVDEGGYFNGDADERRKMYAFILHSNPEYIDIEIGNQDETLRRTITEANKAGVKIILSYHDFKKTERGKGLETLIARIIKKIKLCPAGKITNIIVKIIFTAKEPEDNSIPFKVIDAISREGCNVISFCMGDKGIVSRIMSVLPRKDDQIAGYLTYASINEDITAPGQLHVSTLSSILEPFFGN